jgi:hypothetical protein
VAAVCLSHPDFSIYIEKYKHLSTPNKKVVNKVIDSLIEEKE